MANLVISEVCDLSCAYCFAKTHLANVNKSLGKKNHPFISLEEFQKRLDFLDRSNINEIRLIGGEPTLHPQFHEILSMGIERKKHIVVFTHGVLSESALECLESWPPQSITVLVNVNATRKPDQKNESDMAHRDYVIHNLGSRVLLGYNIDRVDVELDWLLSLIMDHQCNRKIRLGLAHPVLGGNNRYLHPKQYNAVGNKIADFAEKAALQGINVDFDCGFVRCMFSDHDLNRLQAAGTDLVWRCNPILDIGINDQVIHCFPLALKIQLPFNFMRTASQFRAILIDETKHYRQAGIYKECSICRFKNSGECMGGCLSATMRRFEPATQYLSINTRWR